MGDPPKRQKVQHFTQVFDYDFTFFGIKDQESGQLDFPEVSDFVKLIQPLFKKWVFQKEACPTTGTVHYQGRGSLFKKKRHPELCSLLNETDLRGMDVSECSTNSKKQGDLFYALKYDTKIEGPWDDKTYREAPYIPRQYRDKMDRLYPWQKKILDSRDHFEDRKINMVYDPVGNNGKSTVAALGDLMYGAIDLPPVGDHKELMQVACDILMAKQCREPKLVFVDLPRGLTIDVRKFGPFMVAIEQIKKGKVADLRFHYKEWWFDSPQVWVFANHLPKLELMSQDRWNFFTIDGFKNLRQLSKEDLSQMSQ